MHSPAAIFVTLLSFSTLIASAPITGSAAVNTTVNTEPAPEARVPGFGDFDPTKCPFAGGYFECIDYENRACAPNNCGLPTMCFSYQLDGVVACSFWTNQRARTG
ncbi:hypothetical protein VTL71DRAFT_7555 [Oculimacula yallundae]|uniref:Uncharacterized protein n=1 Tax=Oculimacula yallundae TaxID=86028 RepID=A0ABR4BUF9_9HELO